MDYYGSSIGRLIGSLKSLPGIGEKSAQRLAFHIISMPEEEVKSIADSLVEDIRANAKELEKFGISKEESGWFLPPYEYYNRESVFLTEALGYRVLNYTPGTATPADYTDPSMANYVSSEKLIGRLYNFEKANGLDGAIILIHPGVNEARTDRLYNRLGEIVKNLKSKGYSFKSLNEIESDR